MAITNSSIG